MQGEVTTFLVEGISAAKRNSGLHSSPRDINRVQRVWCSLHVVVKPVSQWSSSLQPQTGEGDLQGTLVEVL
jgi:hypothetical protein